MAVRPVNMVEGEFYHVYNRGTDKRLMFRDNTDYQRFIKLLYISNSVARVNVRDILRKNKEPYAYKRGAPLVSIGAYCLMPNHFHLLLTPTIEGGVSTFMHRLCTGYSMYFNRRYNRTGTLLEGPFKSSWVDNDTYLKYLYAYIHLNPLHLWKREGIDEEITNEETLDFLKSYAYSSLPDYLKVSRSENIIVNPEPFPEYFETVSDQVSELKEWLLLREEQELIK
jgi:putative transposase